MTTIAIKQGWNVPTIKVKVEKARAIQGVAKAVGLPRMASTLIGVDMTLQEARVVLFTAKADSDAAIRTDTSPPSSRLDGTPPAIDAGAIYSRLNTPPPTRQPAQTGANLGPTRLIGSRV